MVLGKPEMLLIFFSADDIFALCTANLCESKEVKYILEDYCELSGYAINFHKSRIYFSKGASKKRCKDVASILGVSSWNQTRSIWETLCLSGGIKIVVLRD